MHICFSSSAVTPIPVSLVAGSAPPTPSFPSRAYSFLGDKDVSKLLKECGVAEDKENLKVMMAKLDGKSVPELIAEGKKKFASMPAGGAAAPTASAAPAGEAKAAEKEAEPEEEADVDMGNLFGDDY